MHNHAMVRVGGEERGRSRVPGERMNKSACDGIRHAGIVRYRR